MAVCFAAGGRVVEAEVLLKGYPAVGGKELGDKEAVPSREIKGRKGGRTGKKRETGTLW